MWPFWPWCFNLIFWSNVSVLNKLLTILYYLQIADPGREKSHFFFTLRDSPADFINVNCWGSENYIDSLTKSFRINDIGKRTQTILKKWSILVMEILSVLLIPIRRFLLWFIRAEINLSFLEILRSVFQTYLICVVQFYSKIDVPTLLMEQLPIGWCLLSDKSVEVRNPQIQDKQNSESEQKWRPWTPR